MRRELDELDELDELARAGRACRAAVARLDRLTERHPAVPLEPAFVEVERAAAALAAAGCRRTRLRRSDPGSGSPTGRDGTVGDQFSRSTFCP